MGPSTTAPVPFLHLPSLTTLPQSVSQMLLTPSSQPKFLMGRPLDHFFRRLCPWQTVPKDDCKHRVVLDLSFPPVPLLMTASPKTFVDEPFHHSLPRCANFVDLIITQGSGCFLFKKDFKCAYRQIPVDPRDYNLIGYH